MSFGMARGIAGEQLPEPVLTRGSQDMAGVHPRHDRSRAADGTVAPPRTGSRSAGQSACDHHDQGVDIDPPMNVGGTVLGHADPRCGIGRLRLTQEFGQDGVPERGLQVHD